MRWLMLAVLFFATVPVSAQTPATGIPDFTFYNMKDQAFNKKDLRPGKPTFFIFFDTRCEHCQRTCKRLNTLYPKTASAWVYMLSLDKKENILAFFKEYAPNLPKQKNFMILQDRLFHFIPRFGPTKYPSMFLYGTNQKLIKYSDDEASLDTMLSLINTK